MQKNIKGREPATLKKIIQIKMLYIFLEVGIFNKIFQDNFHNFPVRLRMRHETEALSQAFFKTEHECLDPVHIHTRLK